jgi:putative FmdB family regulatory protein
MPVYTLQCPDCGHRFNGMVMAHSAQPREWACSKCGGRRAAPTPESLPRPHPWEEGHATGCPCCG